MPDEKIEIPVPPSYLPGDMQEKWKKTYREAFQEAQLDFPEDAITQKQTALREANKITRTPELKNYQDCMDLPDWHFALRQPSEDSKTLRVVTHHGKKYMFPIPERKQKEVNKESASQSASAK